MAEDIRKSTVAQPGDIAVAFKDLGSFYAKIGFAKALPGWTVAGDSGSNASQTLTKAAEAAKKHYVTAYEVSISGANAGTDVFASLKEGATVKWKGVIGSGMNRGERTGIVFPNPIEFSTNTAVTLEVTAGGTSVVTHANVEGYTL